MYFELHSSKNIVTDRKSTQSKVHYYRKLQYYLSKSKRVETVTLELTLLKNMAEQKRSQNILKLKLFARTFYNKHFATSELSYDVQCCQSSFAKRIKIANCVCVVNFFAV